MRREFFIDDKLAEAEPLARLLLAGLWLLADAEGRLEYRPRRIRAQVLPYDDAEVERLVAQLAALGFVERYAVDGLELLQIANWADWQKPHNKEPESKLPARHAQPSDKLGASLTLARRKLGDGLPSQVGSPAYSESKSKSKSNNSNARAREAFEAFWSAYPQRRGGRVKAERAWSQQIGRGALPPIEELLEALERHKASAQWAEKGGRFVPAADKWLAEQRWTEELAPAAPELPTARVGVATEYPWNVDDVRQYSGDPRWDEYMDAHEGKPGPWQRFEAWAS